MPIYEYVCKSCGKITDVFQKMHDPPPEKCEGCGESGALSRCMSRTSFVLKGGGWYSDLYASPKKDAPAAGTKTETPSKESASSSGAAAKGASTPAPTSSAAASSPSSSAPSSTGAAASDTKK